MTPSPVMTKRLKEFKYFSPTTEAEAVTILKDYDGEAKVLAGGTDLLSLMKLRAVTPECIVSLKRIAGLDYVREEGKELRIGAMTTIATILASFKPFCYCRTHFLTSLSKASRTVSAVIGDFLILTPIAL